MHPPKYRLRRNSHDIAATANSLTSWQREPTNLACSLWESSLSGLSEGALELSREGGRVHRSISRGYKRREVAAQKLWRQRLTPHCCKPPLLEVEWP